MRAATGIFSVFNQTKKWGEAGFDWPVGKMDIRVILRKGRELGASDVHLTVGRPPVFRLHGFLVPADSPELAGKSFTEKEYLQILCGQKTADLARQIMTPERYEFFKKNKEIDFSCEFGELGRFRVNAFIQRGQVALAIRLIQTYIPALSELGLPPVVERLVKCPRGMVLVTGPTGSGKSTTLAAMVEVINRDRACHILTLEDPIEFVYSHKRSIVNQREIGTDSMTFAGALRAALREDPDVILVGEMRDPETISIALTAAETGHLILATLHTSSAAQTVDRIIDVFPPHQQPQIRVQLSNSLQGVITQQLIPRLDKAGRVMACEVMVATPAIRNLIREGKSYQILSQIQTGSKFGMVSLDASLANLVQKGIISKNEARERAFDPESLERLLL